MSRALCPWDENVLSKGLVLERVRGSHRGPNDRLRRKRLPQQEGTARTGVWLSSSLESRHNKLSDSWSGLLEWSACGTPQCSPSKRSTPALSPCSMSGHAASGLPPKLGRSGGVGSLGSPGPPDSLGSPSERA